MIELLKMAMEGASLLLTCTLICMMAIQRGKLIAIKAKAEANHVVLTNHMKHDVDAIHRSIEKLNQILLGLPCWYSDRCYEIPRQEDDNGDLS